MRAATFTRTTLAIAVLASLTACAGGGGGGGTRSTPATGSTVTPSQPTTPTVTVGNANVTLPAVSAIPGARTAATAPSNQGSVYDNILVTANVKPAHDAGFTGAGVLVGVIDSGVDDRVEPLKGKVTFSHNYAADLYGQGSAPDTSSQDGRPLPDILGHGTSVAEIIAGSAFTYNWGDGVVSNVSAGVAPDARIASGRAYVDAYGAFTQSSIAAAANGVAANGARILNFSIGTVTLDKVNDSNRESFRDIYTSLKTIADQDRLLIWGAGNDKASQPSVLGALPTVFSDTDLAHHWIVAAGTDPKTGLFDSTISNQCGLAMDYCVVANDTNINQGNLARGDYLLVQGTGTSFAAPVVSGTAALVAQAFPYMTSTQIRDVILGTALDLGAPGIDAVYGNGAVDAGAAVHGPGRMDWGDFNVSFNGTSEWSNDISGKGGIGKDGTGNLVLSGNDSYTGATTVTGGSVTVNGTIRSNTTVGAAGTLAGKGIIAANVDNHGTVQVSNGGLSVVGNYTQGADGTLGVDIGSVLKTQSATLDGTLKVTGQTANYILHTKEVVLYAQNGYTGQFASVIPGTGVMLDAVADYSDKNHLALTINRLSVTQAAAQSITSQNVAATAGHVEQVFQSADAAASTTGVASASGNTLTGNAARIQTAASSSELVRSVHSLSGESYATTTTLGFAALDATRNTVSTHLTSSNDTGFWFAGVRGGATLGDRGYYGATSNISGTVAGFDVKASDNWLVGAAVNFTDLSTRVDTVSGQNHSHSTGVSLYGRYNQDNFYAIGQVSSAHSDLRVNHDVFLGDTVTHNGADYNGRNTAASLEAGWNVGTNGWIVTPAARVTWASIHRDGFRERSVAGFNLVSGSDTTHQTAGSIGTRVARDWAAGNWTVTADVSAWYTHLFTGTSSSFGAVYDGAPQAGFQVSGINASTNRWEAGAGLSAKYRNFTVFAHYDVMKSGRGDSHAVTAGVNWAF